MNPRPTADLDQLAIQTLRFLAVDMVELANSGHPGAPLGLAPAAYCLWSRHLRFHPSDPAWPNRDRFVLSCGHASALLYALLHLAGYDLPMEELQRFRQLESRTPGHPEHGLTAGVETTTGPLGQGVGNAVGMAIAQRHLAARFNRPGFPLFDYRVWAVASDGDLMEGVSAEASSLAGHLRLAPLTVLWDDNRITIDGSTDLAFSEEVTARYAAYGWRILSVNDGNDLAKIDEALSAAEAETQRPTLVRLRTVIGFGSPGKQGTSAVHGAPLGAVEMQRTREALGWPAEPTFLVPDEAKAAFAAAGERGAQGGRQWAERLEPYRAAHPDEAAALARWRSGVLPADWAADLPRFAVGTSLATRAASGKVLQGVAAAVPELVGGSADLTESNQTLLEGIADFSATAPEGRHLRFGVREHGMGSVMNGLALSGLRPYGGTFLIFSDYMRPAIRLAALMALPTIYVFTHDSIFLGEDGPTHQPISQLASLRSIPGLTVLRPADAAETRAAWRVALERREGPTALVLTRQKLPTTAQTAARAEDGVPRGAYVLVEESGGHPDVVLLATGSEVALADASRALLATRGVDARVVSMPSWELFGAQDETYQREVLPVGVPRLAIEAASPFGWHRWVGERGGILAMQGFGASAPAEDLARHFGFTPENVSTRAERLLGR